MSSFFFDPSMDSEFWTSRLAAAKRHYTLQHNHPTSHLGLYSCWFSCPWLICWENLSGSDKNLNFIICVFRSVGDRWFWCWRRGETRFPLSVLLWRVWHRIFVFSSWRWTFMWIKSHGRNIFILILRSMYVLINFEYVCLLWCYLEPVGNLDSKVVFFFFLNNL